MIRNITTLICLTFALSTHAAIISYSGYTLDTETNIVTGGGLRWLQWDETVGQSVTQALATHGSSGWRLATSSEMATLFNAFDFRITFEGDDSITQNVSFLEPYQSTGVANQFVQLFGSTFISMGSPIGYRFDQWIHNYSGDIEEGILRDDIYPVMPVLPQPIISSALYGGDQNSDGVYSRAGVSELSGFPFGMFGAVIPMLGFYETEEIDTVTAAMAGELSITPYYYPSISMDTLPVSNNHSLPSGIALVQEVPVPASAWLFASALLGLFGKHYRIRRKPNLV